jgi:hypothetical protein
MEPQKINGHSLKCNELGGNNKANLEEGTSKPKEWFLTNIENFKQLKY